MKIAILSDNHGNVPALETVIDHIERWQPDHVIFNGDVVNRGPYSQKSWQIVQAKRQNDGWLMTRGNHEDYVLKHEKSELDSEHIGISAEINQNSRWTHQQLNGRCAEIATLPLSHTLTAPDGSQLFATHASVRGNTDGIYPDYDDDTIRQQITPLPAVFVTSHIHLAYIKQIDETILVNTGSAGQHCYGDIRASYAQVVWENGRWHAQIIRLNYDMAATERDFYQSGFLDETGPIAHLMFHEWKTGQVILPDWRENYLQAVLDGDIGLETSVIKTLSKFGIDKQPYE
ncbi:MAG: metallophosphoesterase family protein [Anaerolineae bacterium]|nr:metallophosphoesterase family protein [Anaerolineae bacterium]